MAVVGALIGAALAVGAGGCGGGGTEGGTSASSATTQTTTSSRNLTTSTGTTTSTTFRIRRPGPHQTIREAVDAVLTSASPKICGDAYVTAHYVQVAYGGLAGCANAQSPKSAAKSVRVQDVIRPDMASTTSPTAIVKVVPSGGLYDGEKITVSLIRKGGGWVVDSLKSNAPVGP